MNPLLLDRRQLLWIAAAVLLAGFFCLGIHPIVMVDSRMYLRGAQALWTGLWTDYPIERPPGYAFFLLGFLGLQRLLSPGAEPSLPLLWIVTVQLGLSLLTAWLAADLFMRLFDRLPDRSRWAVGVGCLVALSPNLLFYSHAILTETLYTFLLTGTLWWIAWHPDRWSAARLLGLGLLCGGLIWVRTVGVVLLIGLGWLYRGIFRPWRNWAALLMPVGLMLACWVGFQWFAHDYVGFAPGAGLNQLYKTVDFVRPDRPQDTPPVRDFKRLLAERAAIYPETQRYEAVNDVHVLHLLQQPTVPTSQIYLQDDRTAATISLQAVTSDPLRYVAVTGRELWRMLVADPSPWDPDGFFWLPLFLLSIIGAVLAWRTPSTKLPTRLLISVYGFHLILYPLLTLSSSRYRVPLEPLTIILAVYALACLSEAFRQPGEMSPAAPDSGSV